MRDKPWLQGHGLWLPGLKAPALTKPIVIQAQTEKVTEPAPAKAEVKEPVKKDEAKKVVAKEEPKGDGYSPLHLIQRTN